MEVILILPVLVSFFVAFLALPIWIRKAKKIGLVWDDMNKYNHPKNVAGSGGTIVVLGFIFGLLALIAINIFIFNSLEKVTETFVIVSSVLLLAGIGIIDDLFGWQHGGLSAKMRILLVLFAAIPLVAINAGYHSVALPFVGRVDLGFIYPLFLIPIAFIGTSTTFNFLAGFNGLESSQGILLISALSIVAFFTGKSWLGLIGLCLVFSLLAFYIFNKYPAKVFPGDVLTYPVGGMVAIMAILGNFEKIAIFFFIPYLAEIGLKLRGKLKKQSFGKPNKDNSLELAYSKIYGLEHLAIWFLKKIKKDGKAYEKDVVYFINGIQIIIIVLGFLIFRQNIF